MQMLHVVLTSSLVVLLVALGLPAATADEIIVQKREVDPAQLERLMDPKRKRPFCNAFTGCGKKRSDESMATLVEMNSEPAVEELTRQILSEAKLWEAIQEARVELLRRKHHQQQEMVGNQMSEAAGLPLPLRLASYRRKRSAEPQQDVKDWSR
uniref:Crustacean cardioactive peptide n=1 Tax=Carausius morosus TaxID=7022 RepID=A0A6G4ZWW4_CARMO|nr:crustacean cardioactive peptide [Carausius morosus]